MSNENQEVLNNSLTSLSLQEASSSTSYSQESKLPTNEDSEQNPEIKQGLLKKVQMFRALPVIDVPEKIIICVDTCVDDPENFAPFKTGDESTYKTLFMLKRVIEFFVHNKNFMDNKHEFALLALERTNIRWLQDFTSIPRDIIRSLGNINFTCEQDEEYDLSVLLDEVWQAVSIPKIPKDLNEAPPYVVRLILLYSRSYSIPVLRKPFKELLENPYFIIDVIATYDEFADKNRLKEVLNSLQIDEKGYSYNFWVARDAKVLHEAMAKLLGHPLQRPLQSDIMSLAAPVFEKEE